MLDGLTLKPELARSLQRFEAWWHGQIVDRPPVTLSVKAARPYRGPSGEGMTHRQRALDVEFSVEAALARLAQRDYPGDALPIYMPNVGPELMSTPFGCQLEFGPHTSWSVPTIHDLADWQAMIDAAPNFDNLYWRTVETMTRLALQRGRGHCLVGISDLHGNLDILGGLREPQALCMDLIDDPDLIRRAMHHACDAFVTGYDRLWALLREAGQPATTWTTFLHNGPAYVPSCDFWCMLSDDMARDLVIPAILREMRPLQRSIFHLDGPQALRHLDLLLDLPQLDAVQWVYGAGQGPALRWLDVYRRCLLRGKCIELIAQGPDDALAALRALGPCGVWLRVEGDFPTLDQAHAFLHEVESLTATTPSTFIARR